MSLHTEVEAAETVTRQTVTSTLKNNSFRLIVSHNGLNDGFENGFVGRIINTVSKREIDSIIFSGANTNIAELTSTREILAIFVKRDSHNSVGSIESFFNAIAVVNVNVDIQDSLFESEKLDYAKDNVYKMIRTQRASQCIFTYR